MGEFRRATGDLRSTFEGHMRDLEREAELRRVREAQRAYADHWRRRARSCVACLDARSRPRTR